MNYYLRALSYDNQLMIALTQFNEKEDKVINC